MEKVEGRVKWFSAKKGYGFLEEDGNPSEIFVHFSQIDMDGYKKLRRNQAVEFEIQDTDKGLQAFDVTILASVEE